MTEKIPYDTAKIELLNLNSQDILTTSGGWNGPLGGESGGGSNFDHFGWT